VPNVDSAKCRLKTFHSTSSCLAQGEDLAVAAAAALEKTVAIVEYLLQQEPGMHVLLQGILPRGYKDKHTGEFSYKQPGM
jgi:hypothetical protein